LFVLFSYPVDAVTEFATWRSLSQLIEKVQKCVCVHLKKNWFDFILNYFVTTERQVIAKNFKYDYVGKVRLPWKINCDWKKIAWKIKCLYCIAAMPNPSTNYHNKHKNFRSRNQRLKFHCGSLYFKSSQVTVIVPTNAFGMTPII
jgi:hypothetical protein